MVKVVDMETANQPTAAPTNKMVAVGVAGALTVVLVYALGEFGYNIPVEVASAVTVLISFVSGYIVPNKKVV